MPSQKTSCLPTILNQGAIFAVGSLHQQIGPFNWLRQPRGQPDVPRLLHLGEGWWGNWLSPKEVEVLVVFFWCGWSHDCFFWGLGGFTASLICSKCFCVKFAKPNTRLHISKQKGWKYRSNTRSLSFEYLYIFHVCSPLSGEIIYFHLRNGWFNHQNQPTITITHRSNQPWLDIWRPETRGLHSCPHPQPQGGGNTRGRGRTSSCGTHGRGGGGGHLRCPWPPWGGTKAAANVGRVILMDFSEDKGSAMKFGFRKIFASYCSWFVDGCIFGRFTNLAFGICDIYFDLKVYKYYFIIHSKDPDEPTSKMECHKGFDHFSGRFLTLFLGYFWANHSHHSLPVGQPLYGGLGSGNPTENAKSRCRSCSNLPRYL